MNNNFWPDVKKARAEIDAAQKELQPLLKQVPPGHENLAIATAIAHVVGAGVALLFREPVVPFHLAFISPPESKVSQRIANGKIYRPLHQAYHDARLIAVNGQALVIEYQGQQIELPTFEGSLSQSLGQVGIVQWAPEFQCWRFNGYCDQSLRRAFELDHADRIGWRNATNPGGWTAPRCVVPGVEGAFVEDYTEPVEIDVPEEFFELCVHYDRTPEEILRGFIADVCDLGSDGRSPRADQYCSNGSDERMLAGDYFYRAYHIGSGREADDQDRGGLT